MATVGGDGTPLPAPHGDPCLLHQPPRFVPSHGIALGLELLGHAPTPITVTRLGMNRFHTRQQGHLVTIHPWCSLTLGIDVKSAATDLQHLTTRQAARFLSDDKGISHFDSMARTRLFFKISRSSEAPFFQ